MAPRPNSRSGTNTGGRSPPALRFEKTRQVSIPPERQSVHVRQISIPPALRFEKTCQVTIPPALRYHMPVGAVRELPFSDPFRHARRAISLTHKSRPIQGRHDLGPIYWLPFSNPLNPQSLDLHLWTHSPGRLPYCCHEMMQAAASLAQGLAMPLGWNATCGTAASRSPMAFPSRRTLLSPAPALAHLARPHLAEIGILAAGAIMEQRP